MATASDMVELIEDALAKNPLVAEIVVDGQTVKYDRKQALLELDFWRRRAAQQAGTRPPFRGFNLDRAW